MAITEARSLISGRANKSANRHEKESKKKYQQPTSGGVDFQGIGSKIELLGFCFELGDAIRPL